MDKWTDRQTSLDNFRKYNKSCVYPKSLCVCIHTYKLNILRTTSGVARKNVYNTFRNFVRICHEIRCFKTSSTTTPTAVILFNYLYKTFRKEILRMFSINYVAFLLVKNVAFPFERLHTKINISENSGVFL